MRRTISEGKMNRVTALILFLTATTAFAVGRIQDEDVRSTADIRSSVLTTTGNLTNANACISSIGSLAHLAVGQFIYDTTSSAKIPAATTIAGIPGSCSAGQVQMSANATASATGDTITFGGQDSQTVHTSKIWDSFNSQLLSTSISSGAFGGGSKKRVLNAQTGTSYTLALTDGYANGNFPFLTSSNASPQTITVPPNSSVAFQVGDEIDFSQQGAGSVTINPGAGVTVNSGHGYTLSTQYTNAFLIKMGTDLWTLFGGDLAHMMVATCTSCAITTSGNFKVYTFNASDTLVVTAGSGQIASWVVSGGGGAGAGYGGGGGGGGVNYVSLGSAAVYIPGSYGVTIGTGGIGGSQVPTVQPTNGSNSVWDPSGVNIAPLGGGSGGLGFAAGNPAASGGSGGGGSGFSGGTSTYTPGAGTGGQGFAGGTGNGTPYGGGGGGAGGLGHDGAGNDGQGGVGLICPNTTMCGTTFFAGGGGAAAFPSGQAAAGGNGGGGAGVQSAGGAGTTGVAGTANSGGGGGAGSDGVDGGIGGAGGSGKVVLMLQFQ